MQYIGAVDVGGTKIAVGVVREDGLVVSQRNFPTSSVRGWRDGVAAIHHALEACRLEVGLKIEALGIGCTGPVYPMTGKVGKVSLLPGWEDGPLVAELRELAGIPVSMENDADAAALAEARWGCGIRANRFLYVTISTGVGTGLILDGSLYRGANGSHPEMGHHTVAVGGPACYCGASGCLESLVSGTAILKWFREHDEQGRGQMESFNTRSIFELAFQGDVLAQRAVDRFVMYLGVGLANLTTLLVPDVIALGGGVMQSGGVLLSAVRAAVLRRCGEVPASDTGIQLATLAGDIGLVGAAAVGATYIAASGGEYCF